MKFYDEHVFSGSTLTTAQVAAFEHNILFGHTELLSFCDAFGYFTLANGHYSNASEITS